MNANVTIHRGSFSGETVEGMTFPLVRPMSTGKHGNFIVVNGTGTRDFPARNFKIFVNGPEDFTVEGADGVAYAPNGTVEAPCPTAGMTDEEVIEDMRHRFETLSLMTEAARDGNMKALIVSGPPGVGKSHGVEQIMTNEDKQVFVKGAISPIHLYCKLYEYKEKDNVVIFDDCDSVFLDDVALNILKAALDTKKRRRISWHTEAHKLLSEDIPNTFEFEGSVIFISNMKFDNVKSAKLRDHLAALESRCHYIDLRIDTKREKMLRIKQIITDGMLTEYNFSDDILEEMQDFISENVDSFRELSLRMVIKLADMIVSFPNRWKRMASVTLLK